MTSFEILSLLGAGGMGDRAIVDFRLSIDDLMATLQIGARLGPCEIQAAIGAGGRGSALDLAERLPATAKSYENATVWRFPRRSARGYAEAAGHATPRRRTSVSSRWRWDPSRLARGRESTLEAEEQRSTAGRGGGAPRR